MTRYNPLLIPFVLIAGVFLLHGQEGFTDIFNPPDEENRAEQEIFLPRLNTDFTGEAGFDQKFYFDQGWDSEREALPYVRLTLTGTTPSAQVKLDLSMRGVVTPVINELFVRTFFPLGYLDGGLMKREWGKGDGYHVADPLNPLDQREGIKGDLNDMKQPQVMLIWNHYIGESGLLELVYKPFFNPLKTSESGRWAVADFSLLPNIQSAPDGRSWEYTQFAARLSGTFLNIDGGLIYYYGRMSEPGARIIMTGIPETHWVYTRAQLLAAEGAGVLGPLTLRGELGYWLSEDRTGRVEYLYNDRLCWLGGVDLMLGNSSFFISIQEYGQLIMNYTNLNAMDVDRGLSYKNQMVTNNLIATLEGKLFKERVTLRVSGISLLGVTGYMIMPEITFYAADDLKITLNGKFFEGEKSGNNPFYAWRENDNINLQMGWLF